VRYDRSLTIPLKLRRTLKEAFTYMRGVVKKVLVIRFEYRCPSFFWRKCQK